MKYKRFEELPVWNAAIKLAQGVYSLTECVEFKNRASLRDQLEHAAVSVSNNIAEGFERGTNRELLTFLYVARGSAGEVRSMLCRIESMAQFRNLESGILNLKRASEAISKQLGAWSTMIKNSSKDGQKFATDRSKRHDKTRDDYRPYLEELQQIRFASQAQVI